MKVKIKNKENLHDVVAWSVDSFEDVKGRLFDKKHYVVQPVVIIVLRNSTKVEIHPVQDIEELHR